MKVGDLVKIKDPTNDYSSHIGIIASFPAATLYSEPSYLHVLVGGTLFAFAKKNLEVINESR